MPDVKAMIDDMELTETADPRCSPQQANLPFWLPDLDSDWRSRYRAALEWMQTGDRQRELLESQYRLLQKRFESGLSRSASVRLSGLVDGDGETATANSATEVDLLALFQWTQAKQSNLGMVALHRWIDTAALYSSSDDKAVHTNLENDPGLVQAREEAAFAYQEADRFLSRLIRQQPDDVLGWTYRAKVRRNWAALIKLGLLPLNEQPIVCTPAMNYRRMMDSAQKDLEQSICFWSRSFPDPDQVEVERQDSLQSTQPIRPIGSEPQRKLIVHHLFGCYILLYGVYKAERSREKAVAALSKAIWLKPKISLLLARAEQYYWMGQIQPAARDYLTSIQQAARIMPARLEQDFKQGVVLLQLEFLAGEYLTVIHRSCRFWQANPMLLM